MPNVCVGTTPTPMQVSNARAPINPEQCSLSVLKRMRIEHCVKYQQHSKDPDSQRG